MEYRCFESREDEQGPHLTCRLEQSAVKSKMNWINAVYYVGSRERALVCINTVCVGIGGGRICVRPRGNGQAVAGAHGGRDRTDWARGGRALAPMTGNSMKWLIERHCTSWKFRGQGLSGCTVVELGMFEYVIHALRSQGKDTAHRTSPDIQMSKSSDSCDRSMTLTRQLKCPKLAVETWQEQWRN